jgi:flagellin-like protein
MYKKKFLKKAISPLIATILLIVVVVAIIAIVVSWGKGFTREGLDTSDKISVYSESDVSFYIHHDFSMNGRTVIEYKPPANSPFKDLNIIGYGIIGLTTHIVPFD